MTFYGVVNVTEYTMTHEMGHRFNFKSDNDNGRTVNSLYGIMANATVNDYGVGNNQGFLFGKSNLELIENDNRRLSAEEFDLCSEDEFYTARGICAILQWRRGERGWGTGPAPQYDALGNRISQFFVTDFQQDSFTVEEWAFASGSIQRQEEIDEAAADMFLNWVYRKVTNGDEGFKNISWLTSAGCNTSSGCDDATRRPGDARFDWIESTMSSIFTNHPEWQLGE